MLNAHGRRRYRLLTKRWTKVWEKIEKTKFLLKKYNMKLNILSKEYTEIVREMKSLENSR